MRFSIWVLLAIAVGQSAVAATKSSSSKPLAIRPAAKPAKVAARPKSPVAAHPAAVHPAAVKPAAVKPAAKPAAVKPAAKPAAVKPAAKPAAAKPVAGSSKAPAAKVAAAKPVAAKPAPVKAAAGKSTAGKTAASTSKGKGKAPAAPPPPAPGKAAAASGSGKGKGKAPATPPPAKGKVATTPPKGPAPPKTTPIFEMNCAGYPDVCDNFCVFVTCHGFNTATELLHFDANNNKPEPGTGRTTPAADLRRAAIGCKPNPNYCSGSTLTCDEQPPASTYDGGLGCFGQRFPNRAQLQQSGVTRCVVGSQNSRHGNDLKTFYRTNNMTDQQAFRIAFGANKSNAPLCVALDTHGDSQCPDESGHLPANQTITTLKAGFKPFSQRFAATPQGGTLCPSRSIRRRAGFDGLRDEDEEVEEAVAARSPGTTHTVTDSEGRTVTIAHGAAPPALGERVVRIDEDGNPITTFVTSVN